MATDESNSRVADGSCSAGVRDVRVSEASDALTLETLDMYRPTAPCGVVEAADTSLASGLPDVRGTLLSRFKIERMLGMGGAGVVYEAHDTVRDARVAIKTLSWVDAGGIYRIKREFRSLVDLRHPNLVRLHELFVEGNRWCFSMDYVKGRPFDKYVRPGGRLDEARLRGCLSQLLSAVDAIHAAGKLHRDLKPSNVLVTREGRVVVLDFGLAVDLDADVEQTLSHERPSGTPAYMAPEQAMGKPPRLENDLYAVGVMLFEALTGCLPFTGRMLEVLVAKQRHDAPAPTSFDPECPHALADFCTRLLSRDPEVRRHARDAAPLSLRPAVPLTGPAQEPSGARLWGREQELDALLGALDAARRGEPALVILQGESGVGKTSLCEALRLGLPPSDDVLMLSSKCYEHERLPFNAIDPLMDALSRFLRQLSETEAAALMPRDAFALTRVFPVLGRTPALHAAPARRVADEHELRRLAFDAFVELLVRLRDRRALVLAFDDLQWMDGDSAALLQHLVQTEPAVPLLCIATHRSEAEPSNAHLTQTLDAFRQSGSHRVLELLLGPLATRATAELVKQLIARAPGAVVARTERIAREDARIERIARESGGNPFLARELAGFARRHHDVDPGAMSLHGLVRAHLSEMGRGAQSLLETLALASQPLPREWALAAAEADDHDLDALSAAHLLRGGASSDGFRRHGIECCHDRIRETVVAATDPATRRARFAALVRVLSATPGAPTELLSRCLEGAGDRELASEYAERAAEEAIEKVAFDQAAQLFERARQLAPEGKRLALSVRSCEALARAGRGAEAAAGYQRAAEMSRGTARLDLLRRAGEELLKTGHSSDGFSLLSRACSDAGLKLPLGSAEAVASVVWTGARLKLRGLGLAPVRAADDARLELTQAVVSGLIGYLPVQTAAVAGHYLLLALAAGDVDHAVRALGFNALVRNMLSPSGQSARQLLDRMDEVAALDPKPELLAFAGVMKGAVAYGGKRFPEARAHLRGALATLQEHGGASWYTDVAHVFDQSSAFAGGDFADIARNTRVWVEEALSRGRVWAAVMLSGVHGAPAWLTPDDPEGYRVHLARVQARWEPAENPKWPDFMLLLGELAGALYQRDPLRGLDLLESQRARYRSSALTLGVGVAAHGFAIYGGGCAAAALRDDPAGSTTSDRRHWGDTLRSAIKVLRRSTLPSLRAVAYGLQASYALYVGNPGVARDHLRQATYDRERAGVHMYAAASRRRLGQLVGGRSGDSLIAEAESLMVRQGVRNLEAMTELLCPGCRQST